MANELRISDYFTNQETAVLSRSDWERAQRIRDRINSFTDIYDQMEWIYKRRQVEFNKAEDLKLFDIPMDAEIDLNWYHGENEWRDSWREERQRQMGEDFDPYDFKNANAAANFANNIKNSKPVKAIKFIIRHIHAIGIAALVVVVIISLTIAGFYVGGIISSIGHTPFVLCGEDEITGAVAVKVESMDASIAATPEYAANIFIVKARERHWKDNAIVGALSYMLQEGLGMGTFTYEGYWCWNGPGHVRYDKTLNNGMWRIYLAGEGKEIAHNGYYAENNPDVYAAFGIGLLADSDVWNQAGTALTTDMATQLINFCDERGAPWQDPSTQMDWIFDVRFGYEYAFDTNDVDPTTSDLSPEEWCARITCGIGMPAWTWGHYDENGNAIISDNVHVQNHVAHVAEAQALLDNAIDSGLVLSFSQIENLCLGADSIITGGNATIADAAVSLAGGLNTIPFDKHGPDSPNLNKPELTTYKAKHEEYLPGDKYFASCDRAACTAIRWAGADPNFPCGATGTQYNYLKSSDKWVYVGDYGSCTLRPGDVLITKGSGHIKIYVGNEAVRVRFPDSNADMYCASLEDYFPKLYKDDPSYDSRVYAVFRSVKEVTGSEEG